MQWTITSHGAPVSRALRRFIERRCEIAFDRLEGWVRAGTVRVTDVNGPRGGVCKRCRILVETSACGPVFVEETRADFYDAAGRAIRRAAHAVRRRSEKRRGRQNGYGFKYWNSLFDHNKTA